MHPKRISDLFERSPRIPGIDGYQAAKKLCIETTIENHDWLSANTRKLAADNGPVIVCNVGGGNVAAETEVETEGDDHASGRGDRHQLTEFTESADAQ